LKNNTPPWLFIILFGGLLYLFITFGIHNWVPADSALLENGGHGSRYGTPFGINPLFYIFLIVGTGVSMALAAGFMWFARGDDDEPIDYDRL
jgi:hypothetical protein